MPQLVQSIFSETEGFNPEFLEKVMDAGTLKYPLEHLKWALDIPDDFWPRFQDDFNTEGSLIHDSYKRGVLNGQFIIERALLMKAQSGDIEAIKELDKIQRRKEFTKDRTDFTILGTAG